MGQHAAGLDELAGFAAFARTLASRPHPDEIIAGLVTGPLAPYSAFAGILLWSRQPSLRMIGLHGYTAQEAAGFEEIPLDADLPISRAARDGEVVIGSGETFELEYTDERVADPERWERMRERVHVGALVSVPIIGRGIVLGAYGITTTSEREWSTTDVSLLDACGRAIALWMLHPDSGLPWRGPVASDARLTERQARIVRLIAAGKTNGSIAVTLGYSPSTVKQEISRVMKALGARSRIEAAERAVELGLVDGATR